MKFADKTGTTQLKHDTLIKHNTTPVRNIKCAATCSMKVHLQSHLEDKRLLTSAPRRPNLIYNVRSAKNGCMKHFNNTVVTIFILHYVLCVDDSDDDKEVSRKRTVRQAASKAVSKQREILLGDAGSEDEEHEDKEEPYLDPDESGSDEDFMVEDDDDSDYGRSKKRGKKVIRRGRPDKKEKKSPKPRLKATGERSSQAPSTTPKLTQPEPKATLRVAIPPLKIIWVHYETGKVDLTSEGCSYGFLFTCL
uniref:Nuclear casein kinase and cyclin-dependent kinase substrate 1a n=1 Tax=Cyclopterus lumpus TaxID=8103 RepID=A0A8C3AB16_CYCLU